MITRCANPKSIGYNSYGGRGIAVCVRWLEFDNFLQDMGEAPSGLSIDRRDVNGNYEKDNCQWATNKEQNRNKRNNRIVTVRGVTGCLAELVEKFGVDRWLVKQRLDNGWETERAFFTPSRLHKTC